MLKLASTLLILPGALGIQVRSTGRSAEPITTTEVRATSPATTGEARSGWPARMILAVTFLAMAGSVVAMADSYVRG